MKIKVSADAYELNEWISKTNKDLKPIYLRSKAGNAVLIAESEWSAIVETMYLFGNLENAKVLIDSMLDAKNGSEKGTVYKFSDLGKKKFRSN
jgi:PHD/YefM family antitoxin component YafN of YafNO toxin-antitoxin module